MALDRFGRSIHYLRISLTDHCNLRCVYCMPEEMTFRPNKELMQDDEVLLFVRLFAQLGFDKIRLTGGEPTVRVNVVELVRSIASTPGVRSLTMTTNGVLLSRMAHPLAEAGLQRVNISIDTLNPEKFRRLTRWGSVEDVWDGIHAAEDAGLTPLKLNSVIVGGYNESDAVDLVRLTLDHTWQVRFIEMMPFAGATDLQLKRVVTARDIMACIKSSLGALQPVNGGNLDGEARLYRLPGAQGDVGFISSVTKPFCATCTRARLTSDGRLRLCLLREGEVDLLTPLRAGATIAELRQILLDGIWDKPWGHGLAEGLIPLNRVMSEIGG
ncbi:MAG TPA: GTP 3',8-cyclase MoaA [Anaerolineales bacterium]|nr:GTP 3',8-cyclase MoaA [Anaerolineales bacterium]